MFRVWEFTNAHITEYSYKAGEVAIYMQEMHIRMKFILRRILSMVEITPLFVSRLQCRYLISRLRLYHCSPTRQAALKSPVIRAIFLNETCSVMKNVYLKSELAYASVCYLIMLYCRHSQTWKPHGIAPPLPENNHHLISM